ncbi:MAG: DUF2911 domain-containing protein [Cytophagaceae bacterium]
MYKLISLSVLFTLLYSSSFSQINIPRPSPLSTVTQKVGLADVSVTYSRPSAKGRKVFGDLVPFDKTWRTGANEPTKLTFSDSVTVAGNKLPAGEYGLYTVPGANEWKIILGNNPKISAGELKDDQIAASFTVKPEKLCASVETFTIDFTDLTTSSAFITLSWETTSVKFKIENEFDRKVMAEIQQKMDNSFVYYQAASYYLETNRDLKQALEWVNKATEKDPKFWQLHTKAKIQSKLGDCKGAAETAQKSIELAKAAKNDEYVKMNEKLIAECKKK